VTGSLRGGTDIVMVQAHVTTTDLELQSKLVEVGTVRAAIDLR
jgi:hypothetical protein